jgi:hypothetical protein
MSMEERRSAENALWLCSDHAELVDADASRFPVELLLSWKRSAEPLLQVSRGAAPHPQQSEAWRWRQQALRAGADADQAWTVLRDPSLALAAYDSAVDSRAIEKLAIDAQQQLRLAALAAPDESLYEVLTSMQRRILKMGNAFAASFNWVRRSPKWASSDEARAAVRAAVERGLSQAEAAAYDPPATSLEWPGLQREFHARMLRWAHLTENLETRI